VCEQWKVGVLSFPDRYYGKTLVFPAKTDWPKFTDLDWNSDKRHAFLKFRRFLTSMFTALDFLVGNESYGGDWALNYDTTARKAHLTYPPRLLRHAGVCIVRPNSSCTGCSWTPSQTIVLPSLQITSTPARTTTRPCRTTTVTRIASVPPFSRRSSAFVSLLTTRRR